MINKYIKSSPISERQTRSILKYFSLDFEATKIASLTGVSRPTINRFLRAVRERIVYLCEQESVFEKGSVEFDESYFARSEFVVNVVVELRENTSCLV